MHSLLDYFEPLDPLRQPLNLVDALTRLPSKVHLVPEENQLTGVLAWLCDHSEAHARDIATLFVEANDAEATAAIGESKAFAARTWVALPRESGGYWFPDLEIAGSDRTIQIIVEVKVGAEPGEYADGEGDADRVVLQPDAYARAWYTRPLETRARVCRVGTLTREYAFPMSREPLRGRDATWGELIALLESTSVRSAAVEMVARDFAESLRQKVGLGTELDVDAAALLQAAPNLIEEIARRVTREPNLAGGTKAVRKRDYVGTYIKVTTDAGELFDFWFAVVPRGGRYAASGAPDALWFKLERSSSKPDPARFYAAGFQLIQDKAGYRKWALYFPLPHATGAIDSAVIEPTVAAIRRSLFVAGLVSSGLTGPVASAPTSD